MNPSNSPQRILNHAEHILHGGDYNPDQWLDRPDILEEDFRLMRQSGCNTFTLGVFAWTSYEPEDGVYRFAWLDRIMDRMAEERHQVILATPSGSKPAWLSAAHPQIRRVGADGLREPHRTRHNHCWSSPVYRRKVVALNQELASRYHDHPALGMWHVSNEYGGTCYCELCLAAFHRWLETKYRTLDALNRRWWTTFWNHTYTAWEEVDPRDDSIDTLQTDWKRFHTDQVIDFYRAECEPLARLSPEVPRTTNLMGFFAPINYWKLTAVLDAVGDDAYPCLDRNRPDLWKDVADQSMVQAFLRTAARPTGRPWFLMESTPSIVQWKPCPLKAPGMLEAEALNAIANGAEGVLYFQWRKGAGGFEKFHGAVVDHEGTARPRVFQEVSAVSRRFAGMSDLLGSEVRAEAALLYDWESRWQLADSCGTLSHPAGGLGADSGYHPNPHYRELWRRSVAADVISPDHDFAPYKVVVAPQLFLLKPGLAEKIRAYVRGGGIFIGTYYTGYVDEDGACFAGGWPGDGLRELFGIWNEEYDLLPGGVQKAVLFRGGTRTTGTRICERIHAEGAEVLAEYGDDFYEGSPAVTRHRFGNGQAFYLATELAEDGLHRVYDSIIAAAGLDSSFPVPGKPDWVSVCRRAHRSTGEAFVFITNWSSHPATVDLGGQGIRPFDSNQLCSGTVELRPYECLCGRAG